MTGWLQKRFFQNVMFQTRYRRFKKQRTALLSVALLLFFTGMSLTAEIWSNSKPLIMSYQGRIYWPIFRDYHPTDFQRTDIMVMDYRNLTLGPKDWWAWPINQWDPYENNKFVDSYPSPPSRWNWMGTDQGGRDVFARLLYGYRYSLGYAIGVWLFSYIVGTLLGAIMGYFGGRTDLLGMRLIEIVDSVPAFLLLLTLISIFTPNLLFLVIFTVLFDWTGIATYVRGEYLSHRRRDYIEAARAIGAGHRRIMFMHILPNALTPIVTFSPFRIAANISSLAFLDYLGFGLQPPTPSWGELLQQGHKNFQQAEWLVLYPSIFLLLTLVSFISIGLAVREAHDSSGYV
jgi:microcin C transport system permease protein